MMLPGETIRLRIGRGLVKARPPTASQGRRLESRKVNEGREKNPSPELGRVRDSSASHHLEKTGSRRSFAVESTEAKLPQPRFSRS